MSRLLSEAEDRARDLENRLLVRGYARRAGDVRLRHSRLLVERRMQIAETGHRLGRGGSLSEK